VQTLETKQHEHFKVSYSSLCLNTCNTHVQSKIYRKFYHGLLVCIYIHVVYEGRRKGLHFKYILWKTDIILKFTVPKNCIY
jgi:hypothetical protein